MYNHVIDMIVNTCKHRDKEVDTHDDGIFIRCRETTSGDEKEAVFKSASEELSFTVNQIGVYA